MLVPPPILTSMKTICLSSLKPNGNKPAHIPPPPPNYFEAWFSLSLLVCIIGTRWALPIDECEPGLKCLTAELIVMAANLLVVGTKLLLCALVTEEGPPVFVVFCTLLMRSGNRTPLEGGTLEGPAMVGAVGVVLPAFSSLGKIVEAVAGGGGTGAPLTISLVTVLCLGGAVGVEAGLSTIVMTSCCCCGGGNRDGWKCWVLASGMVGTSPTGITEPLKSLKRWISTSGRSNKSHIIDQCC